MRTVYITEDDASIRQLVTYALKTADIEAVGLETGAALFDAVAAKKPDLLILDIMLPDIDGISILRKIRSNPYTAELPVLMLHLYGEPAAPQREKYSPAAGLKWMRPDVRFYPAESRSP